MKETVKKGHGRKGAHPLIDRLHGDIKMLEQDYMRRLKDFQSGLLDGRPSLLADLGELEGVLDRLGSFLKTWGAEAHRIEAARAKADGGPRAPAFAFLSYALGYVFNLRIKAVNALKYFVTKNNKFMKMIILILALVLALALLGCQ